MQSTSSDGRRSRPNITRTRDGCLTCRRRRKKCDQGKPQCSACVRLGLDCEQATASFRFLPINSRTFVPARRWVADQTAQPDDQVDSSDRSDEPHSSTSPQHHVISNHNNKNDCERAFDLSQEEDAMILVSSSPQFAETRYPLTPSETIDHGASYYNPDFLPQSSTINSQSPLNSGTMSCTIPEPDRAQDAVDQPREPWFYPTEDTPTNSDISTPGFTASNEESELPKDLRPFDKLYSRSWARIVLPNLPTVFQELTEVRHHFSPVEYAMYSFTAALTAHSQTRIMSVTSQSDESTWYVPSKPLLDDSRMYYSLAIKLLAEQMRQGIKQPTFTLATLILFMYVERVIGSFKGVAFHENGIMSLINQLSTSIPATKSDKELMNVWIELRAINWIHRIPFTTASCYQEIEKIIRTRIDDLMLSACGRKATILLLMVESLRLSNMILFERFVGRGDAETISSRCYNLFRRNGHMAQVQPWRTKEPILDEDYTAKLAEQHDYLEAWFRNLPLDQLPQDPDFLHPLDTCWHDEITRCLCTNIEDLKVHHFKPLKFVTHTAGMNFVYYVASKIFQSQDVLATWLQPKASQQIYERAARLFILLIRACAGIDLIDASERNLAAIGIIEVIFRCLSQCSPLNSLSSDCPAPRNIPRNCNMLFEISSIKNYMRTFCRYILKQANDLCIFREGISPVHRFTRIANEIMAHEDSTDKDYFFVYASYDMHDKSILTWYSKEHEPQPALVMGRDRGTGKFCCDSFTI